MYNNIGGKIKILALVTAIVEAAGSVIAGIALMAEDDDLIPVGLLLWFVGPLVAWISSWLLYGFGELIAKVTDIERNTRGNGAVKSQVQAKADAERVNQFERLRAQGLISEEDYQKAISGQ